MLLSIIELTDLNSILNSSAYNKFNILKEFYMLLHIE
jgi:hypothetical protein